MANQQQQVQEVRTQLLNVIQQPSARSSSVEAAAAVPTPLDRGDLTELKSIMHPGLVEKLDKHDGQEASFPAWRWQFESLAALICVEQAVDDQAFPRDVANRLAVHPANAN